MESKNRPRKTLFFAAEDDIPETFITIISYPGGVDLHAGITKDGMTYENEFEGSICIDELKALADYLNQEVARCERECQKNG